MKKVYGSAGEALDGVLKDGMTIACRRLRAVRHPRTAARGDHATRARRT